MKKIALGLIALLVLVVAASGCTSTSNITKQNVNSTIQKELAKFTNLKNNQTLKNEINTIIPKYIDQLKSENVNVNNLKITSKSGYTSVTLNTTNGTHEFRFYTNGTIQQRVKNIITELDARGNEIKSKL